MIHDGTSSGTTRRYRRAARLAGPGRWDPFSEFEDLYQRMGQLMDSAFDGLWPPLGRGQAPAADLTETGDAYVAEVELPGVRKDDISVELAGRDWKYTATSDSSSARKSERLCPASDNNASEWARMPATTSNTM